MLTTQTNSWKTLEQITLSFVGVLNFFEGAYLLPK